MSAMLGNVPFAAGFGNGIYVPAAFLLATIVLTIFSVGFAAMAQKVSSVGGFYSYISLGLGRDMGMAAGMASFVSYSVFEASLCGLFAFFGNAWIQTHLRHQYSLDLACSVHDRADLGPELPGRAAFGQDPRRCAYSRGDHPGDFRCRRHHVEHVEFQCRGSQRLQRQHTGCRAEGGGCRHRGRRRGGRHLHGLLVLGRLRDGAQLRRGIARSQAHHSALTLLLSHRARTLLHLHQLVRDLLLPDRRRHARQGRRRIRAISSSPRSGKTSAGGRWS